LATTFLHSLGPAPAVNSAENTRFTTLILIGLAATVLVLHLLTSGRYGFHRDELQFLSDGRHLDWGFVVYPPLTSFLARISFILFGPSLVGLRLFAVLAQACSIVVSGLMAREFGGRRLAQLLAAITVALTPISIHYGTELIYSSFDYLWWLVAAYGIIRLLSSDDSRWWLLIGIALGLGLETKYTIASLILGIFGAMAFTPARRYFYSRWFWTGAGIAMLIALPNILWQFQNHFISAHWMHSIHARDLGLGRDRSFIPEQFILTVNLATVPLWLTGLASCWRSPQFRPIAWLYLIPLLFMFVTHARGYYVAPLYPMLLAMGAVTAERWLPTLKTSSRYLVETAFITGTAAYAIFTIFWVVPVASSGPIYRFAMSHNVDLRDEVGWEELVQTVAKIRNSIQNDAAKDPPGHTRTIGVLVGNYGENGAIELYGPQYGLPAPISATNSSWVRGYATPTPDTLIVLGLTQEAANGWFPDCRIAATFKNSEGIENQETDPVRSSILVCGPPRLPWPQFWKAFRSFG
jgi:hypothetical protein